MISEVPSEQTILINNTTDSKYEQDTYTYNSNNEWLVAHVERRCTARSVRPTCSSSAFRR